MVHLKEHIWLCQVIRHINDDMMILHHDSNAFKIFQASLTSSFNKELSKSSYIWDLHWAMLSSLAPMPSQAGHGQRQRGVSFHDFGVMRQRYATISELNWIAKHGPSCDQSIPLSDTMRLWRDLVSSCAAACLFPPRGKSTKSIGKPLDWDWSKAQKHFPRCALFWVCDSVTVCDSLWQFVTVCDVWWFHVHCIVTRITRIVYDISVWFIYDIFMSIFPFSFRFFRISSFLCRGIWGERRVRAAFFWPAAEGRHRVSGNKEYWHVTWV